MNDQYISEIFDRLRKGQFICSNSPTNHIKTLYKFIEDDDNFEDLSAYFLRINFVLERGDEYFYFSRKETTVDLERKLEKAFTWIDVVDFLKTFDSSFDIGFRFTPSEIHNQLKNNASLKHKLDELKKSNTGNKTYLDRIQKIIDRLEKDNFIALESEVSETYKVLSSFHYLKDLINTITIPEDIENEIPE